ncbi:MAG: prepilin-type N-terminal cleavage/methylation domain-containing protein [Solirubrobacteraceae bacterium]
MRRDQDGFTLIELLVVILIIGILAAIALPAHLGQRARSQDTAAKMFARHAQTAMETHYHSGLTYVNGTVAVLQDIEPSLLPGNGPTLSAPSSLTTTGYVITVTSKSLNTFTITKVASGVSIGVSNRTCTRTNTKGGCKAARTW